MKKLLLKLIYLYRRYYSPTRPACCIFVPTCSEYAKECYMKFNFFKASFLTAYRILRCNPFSKGGFDPVPLTRKEKKEKKEEIKPPKINI